jgi:hypothetical protein
MTVRRGIEARKLDLHADLLDRIHVVQAAMQQRAGLRPKITINDVVQELLDEYDKTSALMRDLGVKP